MGATNFRERQQAACERFAGKPMMTLDVASNQARGKLRWDCLRRSSAVFARSTHSGGRMKFLQACVDQAQQNQANAAARCCKLSSVFIIRASSVRRLNSMNPS